MFVCSVCSTSFRNWTEHRLHVKSCSVSNYNVRQSTINKHSTLVQTNASQHSLNTQDDVVSYETLPPFPQPTLHPLTTADDPNLEWRVPLHPPSNVADTASTMHRDHLTLLAADIRRHERRLDWTNNNFSFLSQLINSLSLSQSDTTRLLVAV